MCGKVEYCNVVKCTRSFFLTFYNPKGVEGIFFLSRDFGIIKRRELQAINNAPIQSVCEINT